MNIYLIGSLENENVPKIGRLLRSCGHDVFDDWFAAGPDADKAWKRYEQARGRTYEQALRGRAAEHVFDFDHYHLNRADAGVLVLPAGRSGHIELGYLRGRGKYTAILLDTQDVKWDVMYRFAHFVTGDLHELLYELWAENAFNSATRRQR